ncbi:probable serine threonine- kinase DDB_G0271682, partial [Paramuricea clavata]
GFISNNENSVPSQLAPILNAPPALEANVAVTNINFGALSDNYIGLDSKHEKQNEHCEPENSKNLTNETERVIDIESQDRGLDPEIEQVERPKEENIDETSKVQPVKDEDIDVTTNKLRFQKDNVDMTTKIEDFQNMNNIGLTSENQWLQEGNVHVTTDINQEEYINLHNEIERLKEENFNLNGKMQSHLDENNYLKRENSNLETINKLLEEDNSIFHQMNIQPMLGIQLRRLQFFEMDRLQQENSNLENQIQEKSELDNTNQQLQQEKSQLDDENQQLRQEKNRIINENQQLRQEKSQLKNENQQLRQERDQLDYENQQLRQENAPTRERSVRQRESAAPTRERRKQLRHQKSQLRNENQLLREEKAASRGESCFERRKQLRQEKSQLNNENQLLREEKGQLNNENQQFREEKSQLDHDNQQLRQEKSQLNNENQLLREEKAAPTREKKLRQEKSQLNNENQLLREEKGQLNNENQQFREEKSQLDHDNQQLRQEKSQLNNENQLLREEKAASRGESIITESGSVVVSNELLGKGAWGAVWAGDFYGTKVAVKEYYEIILSPHNLHLFQREINIASHCRHPNLLQFICATKNHQNRLLIVTELMDKALRAFVEQRARERSRLEYQEIKSISVDVARGLNYLHSKKPKPIIHRDVSSANVLLSIENSAVRRAKISDYGSANFMEKCNTANPGAAIYAAPEADRAKQDPKPALRAHDIKRELQQMQYGRGQRNICGQQLQRRICRCRSKDAEQLLPKITQVLKTEHMD